jgi:TRAP-type C4-dicarboxylate transport system permease large subunit
MTLAFGLLTPLFGICALTACSVAGMPVTRVLGQFLIMTVALLVVLLACALMPPIVLILPQLMVPQWI